MEDGVMFRCSVFYEMGMSCDTAEEKAELWQAIMEYGMFGKEPPQKFKRDFVNVRFILEKNKSIKKKRSEAGKSHTGNQYTQGDEKRKSNSQAQTNTVEQMEQMEQGGTNGTNKNKNKKENKNIKKEIDKEKKLFLEKVYLTEEQYNTLTTTYELKDVNDYINRLNGYIGQHGDRYNNHYMTLLTWMRKDMVKKKVIKPLSTDTGLGLIQIKR